MKALKPGEKLIAKNKDYTSGSIGWFGGGVNDAYDLYLVDDSSMKLTLIIFMKIQFIFKETKSTTWSMFDKNAFISSFESAVNTKWGNKRLLKTLPKGQKIYIDFRFETISDGWSITEHWEVHVKKIEKGGFSRSSVSPLTGTVNLDTEDFNSVFKGNGMQRGVVHEFGHMLGLPDEYIVGSPDEKDFDSIMNSAEIIKDRHDSVYIKWLDKVLAQKGLL